MIVLDLLLSYVMFGSGIITMIITFMVINSKERDTDNILFAGMTIGSSVWSLGFGILFVQKSTLAAYYCRCVGMIGTFACMIFSTMLLYRWNGKSYRWMKFIEILPFSAFILYPFLMQQKNTSFHMSAFGMSYTFNKGIWNDLYTLYCSIVAFNLLILIAMMCTNRKKWIRVMGYMLIVCEIVIIFGMLLDTFLPMFGIRAFPGSSITQSFGTILMCRVYLFRKKNRIKIENVSEFIYYSVESPMLIYDENMCLKIANKSAEEFFKLEDNKSDSSLSDLFDVSSDIVCGYEDVVKVDAKCLINDAHCRLAINKMLDYYHEVLGYLVVVDDLTDKMQIIEELEEAKKRADIANRAKSTFLAQMSHEIRTPLNTVLGMNEMILREAKEAKLLMYSKYIKTAGEALLGIINDILDISKLEAGKIQIINNDYNLKNLLKDMINLMSLKIKEKKLTFRFCLDKDVPVNLYGDELRIKQIITNIMNNAVKYTDKGSITLDVSCICQDENNIELVIKVTDTGRGIRSEDMEKMFKPFERLEEWKGASIEGNGLGLAITKELINRMDGELSVESEYGKGSTFCIKLPQRISDNKVEFISNKYKEKEEKVIKAPGARILVVDDMESNLIVIQSLLERTGINVELAGGGKICLDMMRKNRYDMVLLDHMMPEMDGIETLKYIREINLENGEKTPVIVMTANAIVGSREKYIDAGFDDYLPKPVDYKQLEEMIIKYLPQKIIQTVK